MSLIDDIGFVPFSASKAFGSIQSPTQFSAWTIQKVKDTLVAGGWTLTSTLPASTTVSFPFGYPGATGTTGSGPVGCGGSVVVITTPTQTFRYCPYYPGATPNGAGGPCVQFPLGNSTIASLENLCSAINGSSTPYTATLTTSPTLYITLTANTAGPFSNFDQVTADGAFALTPGTVVGGGYLLASNGPSPYTVAVYGQVGVSEDGIQFDFTVGPSMDTGVVSYYLGTNGVIQYNVAANPYSFALFDGVTPLRSIAAFAPDVLTSEGFSSAYCVFVVGPSNLTDRLLWDGGAGAGGNPCSISLDAPPISLADNLRGPQVLVLRVGGAPAVTLNGQPLLTAAYAMMAPSFSAAPGIVGKLWDCQVITKTLNVGGPYQIAGRNYVVIASQDGTSNFTPASLLFCVDDNGL